MTSASPERRPAFDPLSAFVDGGIADIPAVARLARLSFDPHFREAWNEAQMAAVLGASGGFMLVHGPRPQPLAFALCRQILDEVELLLCATHPDHRRAGLGKQTILAVVDQSRSRDAVRLFLEVRASNLAARALYASCGMQQTGVRKSYYRTVNGEPVDAITLGLSLKK